eukprot:TRINITY_DN4641_c0_g1_i1.p1 TRINITY_DN4641_c0_g1~~TRINITY_DN4641_c0_g1_i1.p1  ORF type:complete len:235 (-),score=33.98 TRINITY_DN4641_c0_g1_i1:63-767(-)
MALNADSIRPAEINTAGKLTLLSMSQCPYAQRARLALAVKGIEHHLFNVDLKNKPQWFFDLNPNGQVPTVVYNGEVVYESTIVMEYLDEAFPGLVNLFPDRKEAALRARIRLFQSFVDKKLTDAFYKVMFGQKAPGEEEVNKLNQQFEFMEQRITSDGMLLGLDLSAADLSVYPFVERAINLGALMGYNFNRAQFPRISAWYERLRQNEGIRSQSTNPDEQRKFYEEYMRQRQK